MSTNWKPGDVAMATFFGEESVRVVRYPGGWARLADTDDYIPDSQAMGAHVVADPRPLVVIDPEDMEVMERVWRMADHTPTELQAALREFANPTPPKPDEPQGLGAVVEDDRGLRWCRVLVAPSFHPWAPFGQISNDGAWRAYADISVVRVLSEGVTS